MRMEDWKRWNACGMLVTERNKQMRNGWQNKSLAENIRKKRTSRLAQHKINKIKMTSEIEREKKNTNEINNPEIMIYPH